MQPPVIFVLSKPHHGKTAARKILSELTHLQGESCSTVIYNYLATRRKVDPKALLAEPKEALRPTLIEVGDFLVGKLPAITEPAVNAELDKVVYRVPSSLVRLLYLNGNNIIDGVRRRQELVDARIHLDWNGVRSYVLWIERPGEPTVEDNTELTEADADETIINGGTLEDLKRQLQAWLEKTFGPQPDQFKPIDIVQAADLHDAAKS